MAEAARAQLLATHSWWFRSGHVPEFRSLLLRSYLPLPNYRNYWKEAGYVEEVEAVEKALANREREKIPSLLSDRWLADSTLFGTAAEVREGVEAWYEAGVRTPMLVPSSAVGNQMKAFEELFAIF